MTGARALAVSRLTLALDRTEDEIERLWEIDATSAVTAEWDRLRERCRAIERTIRRLESVNPAPT